MPTAYSWTKPGSLGGVMTEIVLTGLSLLCLAVQGMDLGLGVVFAHPPGPPSLPREELLHVVDHRRTVSALRVYRGAENNGVGVKADDQVRAVVISTRVASPRLHKPVS